MDTSYIHYLLEQEGIISPPPKRTAYQNRRRHLLAYSIAYDNTRLAGYEVKNPFTGHNYAYRLRVKKTDWEKTDKLLKEMFLAQALFSIPINCIYIWWAFGFSSVLWSLGHGVVITEAVAGYVDKHQKEYTAEQLRNIQARGPNAGSDFEKAEYQAVNNLCKRVGMHNEPIEHSDMDWVAGALKQRRVNDKIKPCQGISAVTSITTGHVAWDLLVSRLLGKKPFSWTAALLGLVGVFNLGRIVYMWAKDKSKKEEDEAQIAHSMHFGPAALGAWLAYRGPGNPYW